MSDTSTVLNFIGGQFRQPVDDHWIDNMDPASGVVAGKVANSNHHDVAQAVRAAQQAFPTWSSTPVSQRAEILNRIAAGIDENLEALAQAECLDGGKPISRARGIEIPRAASNFRFYASAAAQFSTECHESTGLNAVNLTLRKPLGVVGCISPWNLPLYLLTWKVAPCAGVRELCDCQA